METTIEVKFKLCVEHDKRWSEEELLQVAEDLVSYEWPHRWAYEGIEMWHVEDKKVRKV
jgi:hypothetical protein